MPASQQTNSTKKFERLTIHQRAAILGVFFAIVAVFALLRAAEAGMIDLGWYFGVCGFKQKFGLPCPGCYITTAAKAFATGHILNSFYIQPAGAVLCCCLAGAAVFALLAAVFGVDFGFIRRFSACRKYLWQIVIAVVMIFLAGWMVTLVRTLSEQAGY